MTLLITVRGALLLAATLSLLATSSFAGTPTVANPATELERQRALFVSVSESVERGDWSEIDHLSAPDKKRLERYLLWPDLRAAWMRANIASLPSAQIEVFVQQYGTLRPARELRYRQALNFVSAGNLAAYLELYQQFYQGQNIAQLDCLALQAEIAVGQHQRVKLRAISLWMVGNSQVNECDPVFEYLGRRDLLATVEYRERYRLAVENRSFSLARWLANKIDQSHLDGATRWQQAQANPADFLQQHGRKPGDTTLRAQLVYAAQRLTFRDPILALEHWRRVSSEHNFSTAQKTSTSQHIALWSARDKLPGAYELLGELPSAAQSDEVLRWRARCSLRDKQWSHLLLDIAAMSKVEQETDAWRYWQAMARRETGQILLATQALELLRHERSYYGFLASDQLQTSYDLDHTALLADESRLAELESRPAVARARELYSVGQDGRGRSEWNAVVRHLSDDDKMQAAILAHRWGWHSRAIATAASLGEYNDLSIRYPLPYQASFEAFSALASIPSTWAYGIARSESLFMRDVRSSAGAIGLMQLMPATGRDVARQLELPYSGLTTLVDPASNIRLGTTYLGQMAERFGGNPVLATAAYNAGPHRVDGWLPESGSVDARIWIENIPFNETRKYVKRVLAAQAIFHWRMTGELRRLSDELLLVQALPETQQIASR